MRSVWVVGVLVGRMPTDDLSRRAFLRLDWLRTSDEDDDADEPNGTDEPNRTIADESVDPRGTPVRTNDRRSGVDDRPAAD
jgi:hypothetical protein